ncbi:MAG: hypothetical protein R6U44_04900 [Archaeoglobaceae archaeon]
MRTEVVYSSSNAPKEAHQQVNEQLKELDIEPNFLFLFLTAGTWKAYEDFNKLLENYFPHAKMLGCIVEGYIAEDEIWTRGVSILLAEFEGEVEVFWANEDSATETVEKLGDKIGEGWDSILLMFPAFYFPGKLEFIRAFLTDKWRYSQYTSKDSIEEKKQILDEYSKYLESKFIFPIDKTLKIMSEKTGKDTPIIGMNLMNLEAASNTPLILANNKNIGRGAAAMCFEGSVNISFNDVFPERGNSYEETAKIIKDYFTLAEDVDLIKSGISIGEINGLNTVDFLRMKKRGYEDLKQDDFLEKVEEGKLEMAAPYHIGLISNKTYGGVFLGLFNYPVNIYPSLFNVDFLHDKAIFCGEFFREGIKAFSNILSKKESGTFNLTILDQNVIMSFGGDLHKLLNIIDQDDIPFFGIFSSFPSAYHTKLDKKHLSEIDKNICVNLTGTSTTLEFM